jgi:electron transfer flavoprotein-quinone oxidoreductase
MFGGVVYGRVLDQLIPNWQDQAPIQRWITRRATMALTPNQSLTIDFRTGTWSQPPYNGASALRPEFDSWLGKQAQDAGATLVCSTTALGLLRDSQGRIRGVRTDRPDGDITAEVVVACDGVNSRLAKEAGLYTKWKPENFALGVKEVLALPRREIEDRFALRGREGADFEILGCTGDVPGGGFLYTNLDTIAIGVVLKLPHAGHSRQRPEKIIADLKAHPSIAPLVEGSELKEYSAHLIPEGGYNTMPELLSDGILVAGDAAALCLAAGIWLEGVNFAISSGISAGETCVEALRSGDTSRRTLASYRRRLESSFVLASHKRLRRAPKFVMSDRVQSSYIRLTTNLMEQMFTVDGVQPKLGALAMGRQELRNAGLRLRDLIRDIYTVARSYG